MAEHGDRRPSSRAPIAGKLPTAIVAVLMILAAVILVLTVERTTRSDPEAMASEPAPFASEPAPLQGGGASPQGFREVAARATEAVVRVESRLPPSRQAGPQADLPDLLEPFFGPYGGQPLPQVAGGSGFLISSDGMILTNAHVVQGGRLTVWLDDGRSFVAELVGVDPTTDVAVLDIDATDLPVLALGDSDAVRVGDWVLAIGSPGVGADQLDQTVTAGIVSAIGRPLQLLSQGLQQDSATRELASYAIENFIQTDAVINPGNSGGPLVSLDGTVIGINTAIASPTGYYLGYGFAIPSDLAQGVIDDLVEYGEVRRARLGVSVTTVTPEDAEYFGLEEVRGVLVQAAQEGSPAAEAGIRRGDVILSLDEERIDGAGELQQDVAERSPGDEVVLQVVRDGESREAEARLDRMDVALPAREEAPEQADAAGRLGLALAPLDAQIRSELGLEAGAQGVVVVDVAPGSPAYLKGVTTGTVLVEVGGQAVRTSDDVAQRLDEVEEGAVTSLLVRTPDGAERLVTVRLP